MGPSPERNHLFRAGFLSKLLLYCSDNALLLGLSVSAPLALYPSGGFYFLFQLVVEVYCSDCFLQWLFCLPNQDVINPIIDFKLHI